MNERTLSLDHPILFVEDFSNPELVIPEYSKDSVVSSNASCISIRAIMYVDGEVVVRLLCGNPLTLPHGLSQVFEGVIATPGKNVAIVTSDNEKIIDVDVPGESTRIIVRVNDEEFPSDILIEAHEPLT
jgi:hypothetical protein